VRGTGGIAEVLLRTIMRRTSDENNYEENFKMRDAESDVSNIDETSITTVLADDLHITGTITFKSSLMIKGSLDGEIVSEGLLVVGPTAKINATIGTRKLITYGEIQGNVTAREQVVLKANAIHTGNITTPDIIVESRSLFNGSCIMQRGTIAESAQNETGEGGSRLGMEAQEPHDTELQPQGEAAPLIWEETAGQTAPISEEHSGLPAEEAAATEDVLSTGEEPAERAEKGE
jgi:cytoskeletal protein CcmA (bactofilin family)